MTAAFFMFVLFLSTGQAPVCPSPRRILPSQTHDSITLGFVIYETLVLSCVQSAQVQRSFVAQFVSLTQDVITNCELELRYRRFEPILSFDPNFA